MPKTRTRRNYGYRRYRQIASRNYFKVKAEFYDIIRFPDNAGQPIFQSKALEQQAVDRGVLTFNNMYTGYSYSTSLLALFSYYKVLGVAVEVIPKYNNGDVVTAQTATFLGIRMGSNIRMNLSEIKAINQNLLLDPRNRQRRYWRTFNTSGDWQTTSEVLNGALSVGSTDNGVKDAQHIWDLKVSMYLLYKYSKA